MTKDEIPTSARQRAVDLANAERDGRSFNLNDVMQYDSLRAFAKYIAAHEEEPVDPLLLEARKLCAERATKIGFSADAKVYQSGEWDSSPVVQRTLAILQRGAEIGRAEAAATDAKGAKQ